MHSLTQTLTQNQQAIRFVARLLLARAPGERLPAIQEINSQLGVGVGTVQKAISALQDAVTLTARGHRGTFVEQLYRRPSTNNWVNTACPHASTTGAVRGRG